MLNITFEKDVSECLNYQKTVTFKGERNSTKEIKKTPGNFYTFRGLILMRLKLCRGPARVLKAKRQKNRGQIRHQSPVFIKPIGF